MTDTTPDTNPAQKRHWVYGFNAAVLVVIGLVILAFLFYLGEQTKSSAYGSFDWTSSGVNSLSGSTKRLLQETAERKQTYKLVSLYPSRSDIEKRENRNTEQDEHRQQVLDLLNEYARRSGNMTVDDYGDRPTEEIQRQIRDLYRNELKPYQDAIDEFDPLIKKISQFIDDQAPRIAVAAQKAGTDRAAQEAAATMQAMFQAIPEALDTLRRDIKKQKEATLPRWGRLKDSLQQGFTEGDLSSLFETLSDKAKVEELQKSNRLPKALADYFISANEDYKGIYTAITAYKDRLSKLQPLKVDDVLESLRRNSVAILGTDQAKVVSDYEIFTAMPTQSGPGVATFNGEQAVSSALFAMVRPEKVKVVFIGGSSPRGGSNLNVIKEVLKAENFECLDWSPPGQPMPGGPPPDPSEPPAHGKGVVWVVFPPAPEPGMMGMSMPANPGPIIDATRKHMAEGGQVLFLAEATNANPMMGAMGNPGGYPYQELIADFGIEVKDKYTAVLLQEGTDRDTGQTISRTLPYVQITRYEDNEITRTMQDLLTLFGPARTQAAPSFPTIVTMQKSPPTGVEGKVIVRSTTGSDIWGESNFAVDAKFNRESDLPPPLDLAAVSIKNKGQKDKDGNSQEQRIAVIGCKDFASDSWLDASQPAMVGGRLVAIPQFPGNQELMKNTILWLSGYENMIAVSAKTNQAVRIGAIPPGKLIFLRTMVLVGIPVAALVLGGMVYMFRRRG